MLSQLLPILAILSGESVLYAVMYLIIIGLCFWLVWWLIEYIGIPEPFHKVCKVILAVAAVFICINVLLSLAGHPLIAW